MIVYQNLILNWINLIEYIDLFFRMFNDEIFRANYEEFIDFSFEHEVFFVIITFL